MCIRDSDRPDAWAHCAGPAEIPEGAEVFLGVDMALRHDSAAVVAVWYDADPDRWVIEPWIQSPAHGRKLDFAAVADRIRWNTKTRQVRAVAYDPRFLEVISQQLEDEGIPMLEWPQSPERMISATQNAYELIGEHRLEQPADPVFTRHVTAAAWKHTERGAMLHKGLSGRPIDACVALVMALAAGRALMAEPETPTPSVAFV